MLAKSAYYYIVVTNDKFENTLHKNKLHVTKNNIITSSVKQCHPIVYIHPAKAIHPAIIKQIAFNGQYVSH